MVLKFEIKDELRSLSGFTIEIAGNEWHKWYKEQTRRFVELSKLKTEREKQAYMKDFPVFDIDAAGELGVMGTEHLKEIIKFL